MQPLDPRDRRIAELERALVIKDQRIGDLERELAQTRAQLAAALGEIEQLKALVLKLSKTSRNSSSPPSKDPPGTSRPRKPKTGRKRGGQPGHEGHKRAFLPAGKVVPVIPESCECCGGKLSGQDPSPWRHQQVEVPPITPQVVDYLLHALKCWGCGHVTRGQLPVEASGVFGARLCAIVAVCSGKFRLSKRLVQELLSDLLGVDIALGSVSNIEARVSSALESPVAKAEQFVPEQPFVHLDETGWREAKHRAWLWVAATSLVVVFRIACSRSKKVAQELVGMAFAGVAISDRWSAYNWLPVMRRQLCWAHLLRDFQSWVDRGGKGAVYGKALLKQAKRMFRWWHRVRDGTWTREKFERCMRPLMLDVAALLTTAQHCRDKRVAGMANEILKLEAALWTFVHHPGIEPTNNFAERCVRHAVLWRKGSFGTDSVQGSRFVERILTVVTTLKLQRRNVLEYLTEAYRCSLRGEPAPCILPHNVAPLAAAA